MFDAIVFVKCFVGNVAKEFEFVLIFLEDEKGLSVGMFDVLQNTSSFLIHFPSFSCQFVCF